MRKTVILFILVSFVFCANFVFAQYNDGTVPGPQTDTKNIIRQEIKTDRVVNQPTRERTDEYGSYNFNAYLGGLGASGGYVAVPGVYNENVDGSIEAWIYPTATTSSAPAIVGKGDATNVGFMFMWTSSGLLSMRFGNTSTTNTGGTIVPLNQWTHVAVTWTGGAGNYTVTFYVNGVQSGSPVTNTGSWNVTNDSLTIGSIRAPFGGKNFYGYIDEVRYWYDVRTEAEIRYNRFTGIGDGGGANTGGALTSSTFYAGCNCSWTFNAGGVYDDIGGFDGFHRNGSANYYAAFASQPIPYNLALYLPGGNNDNVRIPSNSLFNNQTVDGSIDLWINTTSLSPEQIMIAKGGTGSTVTFMFGITPSGKLFFRTALNPTISDGPSIVINKWTHVAVTWGTSGSNFNINFYVDGVKNGNTKTIPNSYPVDANQVYIGNSQPFIEPFRGYIDEVRFWGTELTLAQIRKNMFVTCRKMAGSPTPFAAYNFDGNLLNFTTTTGINGTFNNGATNNCRLSGFKNETYGGAPSNSFIAHPTVINRGGTTHPFSAGYNMRYVNKTISDNTTIYDTLHFVTSRAITSVEVFIAIQHTYVGDLTLELRAPNNTTRTIIANTGGTGEGILTFFVDGSSPPTTAGFFAPWSNIAGPPTAFGTFGSANMLGNWILSVNDNASPDAGVLMAWGIRFNGDVNSGVELIAGNIPENFELFQNYPNPFNPVTTIKFDIPDNSNVKLSVFDMLGREVKVLLNENKVAGSYSVDFDAAELSSGTYFYKITAGKYSDIKKMVVLK
jgi:subtilisin-like proprotein convertase family protein